MLILLERSSAVLAKVGSKSCLSAVVDARLVDIRKGYNLIILLLHQQGPEDGMHTKLAHKYTKIKTYWIKYKFYDLRFIRLLKNLFCRNICEKKFIS